MQTRCHTLSISSQKYLNPSTSDEYLHMSKIIGMTPMRMSYEELSDLTKLDRFEINITPEKGTCLHCKHRFLDILSQCIEISLSSMQDKFLIGAVNVTGLLPRSYLSVQLFQFYPHYLLDSLRRRHLTYLRLSC